MCMCMCACACAYVHVHVHVRVCMCVFMCVLMCVHRARARKRLTFVFCDAPGFAATGGGTFLSPAFGGSRAECTKHTHTLPELGEGVRSKCGVREERRKKMRGTGEGRGEQTWAADESLSDCLSPLSSLCWRCFIIFRKNSLFPFA